MEEILSLSFTGLLISKTLDSCLQYVSRQEFFSVGCIDSHHPPLPRVLFLKPQITSKYLSVIVFLDFHFLVWNSSAWNSSVTLKAFCCLKGPNFGLLFLLQQLSCILSSMWAPPLQGSLPIFFSVITHGPHPWLHLEHDPLKNVHAHVPTQINGICQLRQMLALWPLVMSCNLVSEIQFLHL